MNINTNELNQIRKNSIWLIILDLVITYVGY